MLKVYRVPKRQMNKGKTMNLSDELHMISDLGDRDEASMKHLAHSLAALYVGKMPIEDNADYRTPECAYYWGGEDEDHNCAVDDEQRMRLQIRPAWTRITMMRDNLGCDKFINHVEAIGCDYLSSVAEQAAHYVKEYHSKD